MQDGFQQSAACRQQLCRVGIVLLHVLGLGMLQRDSKAWSQHIAVLRERAAWDSVCYWCVLVLSDPVCVRGLLTLTRLAGR